VGMKRLVHADVRQCFDRIAHARELRLLEKEIVNSRFLDLIRSFLTTPFITGDGTHYTNKEVGIPQGGVLSPILMNVVLHELDLFAVQLCNQRGC
jgi:retron-type reverse transcriptase